MKSIAVIGSGIAGLVCAYRLDQDHAIEVFEAQPYPGGHTRTEQVELDGRVYAVDTGFIVYNERNYPHFTRLLEELGVPTRPTEMSFSVSCRKSGLEYNGHTLATLFAQRRNLLRPSFHRLLLEIVRFNRFAKARAHDGGAERTLGELLEEGGFSKAFADLYLLPLGAAIWSGSAHTMRSFPARFFLRFLENHGLLELRGRPQWRTVVGGSGVYVEKILDRLSGRVRLSCPVRRVRRRSGGVEVTLGTGDRRTFDEVILACHSGQALALLEDATAQEREILSALPYQDNEVVLHTDSSVLPRRRRAWASWNYSVGSEARRPVTVTYNMNILQGIEAPVTFCVTLNPTREIAAGSVLRRLTFSHPQYTLEGEAARSRRQTINGKDRIYYCGAYWGAGFHEDGVESALEVLRILETRP